MAHIDSYLAGVIDSDGSISISRKKRTDFDRGYSYIVRIQIGLKRTKDSENMLNIIKENYGGNIFSSFRKTIFSDNIEVVKYNASSKTAENMLNRIVEHLIVKKQQALYALELRSLNSNLYRKGNPKPDHIWEKQDIIYSKMLKQKARGKL